MQLVLVQAMLNTTLRVWDGDADLDELVDVDSAQAWLTRVLDESGHGAQINDVIELTERDLRSLRVFREDLRTGLRADGGALDDRTGGVMSTSSTVKLTLAEDGGLTFQSVSQGWRAISGLVLIDLLLADARGDLRRLKTCANGPCGLAFYDRSPNVIRMWHDTKTCGNLVNLRAARNRRRAI